MLLGLLGCLAVISVISRATTGLLQSRPAQTVRCNGECTVTLQNALDSGAEKILVHVPKSTRLGNITIKSVDQILEFMPGAELIGYQDIADKGMPSRSLFQIKGARNFTFVGNNAIFRDGITMAVVGNSSKIRMSGLKVILPGWDGLYVSGATELQVRNCTFDRCWRNGMSVISAAGMLVESCMFSNSLPNGTGNVSPMAGVDLEPNFHWEHLRNLSFVNCKAVNNSGPGFQVFPGKLSHISDPISVSFVNCLVEGVGFRPEMFPIVPDGYYFDAWTGRGVRGFVHILGGTVRRTASFGAAVYTHASNDAVIEFEKVLFENVAVHQGFFRNHSNGPWVVATLDWSPIIASRSLGGVRWTDCTVRDERPRPFLLVDAGAGSLAGISASVAVHNPHKEGCNMRVEPQTAFRELRRNISIDCTEHDVQISV